MFIATGIMLSIPFRKNIFNSEVNFPVRYQPENLAKIVSAQFLLIFLTLYFFKPFTVTLAEQRWSYLTSCCLHALLPALIVFVYMSLLSRSSNKQQIKNWTLTKELLHLAILFLLIGLSSFLLRSVIYTNSDNISWHYFWIEIRNVYLAGTVFCLYLITTKVYFNLSMGKSTTIEPNLAAVKTDFHPAPLFIKTHVRIDDFYLNVADLLFARAEGNYVQVYTIEKGTVHSDLKRISLKQLELQLAAYPDILRCHRAYLLNIKRVARLSGNAQGYLISFDETDHKVPVSRTYLSLFDSIYQPGA